MHALGVLLILYALAQDLVRGDGGDLEAVLQRCCALGSDWARQRSYTSCSDFPPPVSSVSGEQLAVCIAAADICCRRDNRNTQCRRGTNAALDKDKRCGVNTTEFGEAYKDCCEACRLGMISRSLGEHCHLKRFSFGLPWDEAYHECCSEASGPVGTRTSAPNQLAPALGSNQTLCDQLGRELCAHVCVATPGSFRCECHPGFALMSDGKSCVQLKGEAADGCAKNNPCMHICRDTGLALECACQPGYELQPDNKSCVDIDECATGSHLCQRSTCRNNPGGYTCIGKDGGVVLPFDATALDNALPLGSLLRGASKQGSTCPPGYEYNSVAGVCDDVDECLLGTAQCRRPEDCFNTVGSYLCDGAAQGACPPGYVWDDVSRRCADKDECEDGGNDCDEDTQFCLNSQGGYSCLERTRGRGSCPAGYKKDPTHRSGCKDVDECLEQIHDCILETEVCRNFQGGYGCDPRCETGFRLDPESRTCQDLDECEELGAAVCPGQRCVNAPGSFLCVPGSPQQPPPPQQQSAAAVRTPSSGREPSGPSTASKPAPGACPTGFKAGASAGLCDDVNECLEGTHNCQPGEVCVNEVGRFRCQSGRYPPGYPPTTPSSASPSTDCPQGYQFSRQHRRCIDVDECALGTHSCSPSEQCVNEEGAFQCSPACRPGHRVDQRRSRPGSPVCEDIDECAEGLHSCLLATQRCRNTNGSFLCEDSPPCPPGYARRPLGGCDDVDECLQSPPPCPDACLNTPGSFRCVAQPAAPTATTTTTTTTTTRPPPAAAAAAAARANRPPLAAPTCPAGFRFSETLRRCLDVDECGNATLHICNAVTETCINEPGGYRCLKKEAPSSPSAPPPPPALGTASGTLSARTCEPGFTYSFHNRKCVDDDECVRSPCDSNQRCQNTVGSYRCDCREGFKRDQLTQACVDINECQLKIDSCAESQRCDNTIGSFQCIRHAGCGTGYTLNAATGACEDDNECEMGTDNCRESGPTWVCRNTQGSFRCERKHCADGQVLQPSGECLRIECDPGYHVAAGTAECTDIDECAIGNPCPRAKQCVNTPGSFLCVFRIQCRPGYAPTPEGDRCVDEDECALGTHACKPGQTCQNRVGNYQCQCPAGHTLDENKDCVDVDECARFPRQACSDLATCENTVGSYLCHCKQGFRQGRGKNCDDVDECLETPGLCDQQCINVWGAYRCACGRGFTLHSDNRTCIDIDECNVHRDRRLCVGDCHNTPGSYRCSCPPGYRLGKDGRSCTDIDECATRRECRGPGEVCLNMQGSFRCNSVRCPDGYKEDQVQKNRCRRLARNCPADDAECRRQPLLITSNYMSLVSNMTIPTAGMLDLFFMRGAPTVDAHTTFTLELESARAVAGVPRATRDLFRLTQERENEAKVSLLQPLAGPQDVELRLSMEVYSGNYFAGLNVAKLYLFVSQHEF